MGSQLEQTSPWNFYKILLNFFQRVSFRQSGYRVTVHALDDSAAIGFGLSVRDDTGLLTLVMWDHPFS